jgi:hypothetical protein
LDGWLYIPIELEIPYHPELLKEKTTGIVIRGVTLFLFLFIIKNKDRFFY